MSASRRELLVAGGCVVLAGIVPGTAVVAGVPALVLLTDDPGGQGARGAILLPPDHFVDDALVEALLPGDYVARLSPANTLLLLEALRVRRITAHKADDAFRFTIGRRG